MASEKAVISQVMVLTVVPPESIVWISRGNWLCLPMISSTPRAWLISRISRV